MPFHLESFADVGASGLSAPLLAALVDDHARTAQPRSELFWAYYRNRLDLAPASTLAHRAGSTRAYRQPQERGLPPRLTTAPGAAARPTWQDDRRATGKEIVIENDIAWRIHAMVDFLFGKPIRLVSTAADPALREKIERALDTAWEASGGMSLLQDAALLGHVHGHVDLVLRTPAEGLSPPRTAATASGSAADLHLAYARDLRIEIIDPARGIPITSAHDYRELDGYIVRFQRPSARIDPSTGRRGVTTITEILSGSVRHVYEDDTTGIAGGNGPRLIVEAENLTEPGRVPVVHIQNVSQPFVYSGLSEVEPLIPLQDELNTRLCDRASRVTFQSFKMYLARGIEGFDKFPVAPGTVWVTDNPDAQITSFGGDGASPSEESHIAEVREAMDKVSSVPPLATGVVQAKVGNLSSENALRLTLSGLLARTQRKRLLYGRGIEQVSRLILAALDTAGVLHTHPDDRGINVQWPDPLPGSELDSLAAAKAKRELGIDSPQVLGELGYGRTDVGVT